MQIVFTWIAVGEYQSHCIEDVEDKLNSSGLGSGNLTEGPGFILCWLGCFLEMLTGTVHMILKAPVPMQYGPIASETCWNIEFEKDVTLKCCCPYVQDKSDISCTPNPSAQPPADIEMEPPGTKHAPDGAVGQV